MIRPRVSCDIFCRVVDNFGDIGVTWRLARQLTLEHGVPVRLIVDDLRSFSRIEPTIDITRESQEVNGVTVIGWEQIVHLEPASLVIESFAINLPMSYVAAMAANVSPPVWINLEYLSGELWVGEHHLLPSPHPKLLLTKYFFFPGFAPNTGGLIRERNLLAERDAFASIDSVNHLRIFLFSYANGAGDNLIRAIRESSTVVKCTIPHGAFAANLQFESGLWGQPSHDFAIETIPFVAQRTFDRVLWSHDVLFVRGEDSFVRAQWAAKPFVWHIYPQSENAHWVKLHAFLLLYCDGLERNAASALRELWRAWNAEDSAEIGTAWRRFIDHLPTLQVHAGVWSKKLAQMPDLVTNLLSFYQKSVKI